MKVSDHIAWCKVVELNPHTLNRQFTSPLTEAEMMKLYTSIRQEGIQEPIWVTCGDTIVSGHERWNAARHLGIEMIPTRLVEDADDQDILYLLISANSVRRGDETDPMVRARRCRFLYDYLGVKKGRPAKNGHDDRISADEVSRYTGDSSRTIRRLLRLLDLIPELQQLVSQGLIGVIAGNDLAALPIDEQWQFFAVIHEKGIEYLPVAEIKAIRAELEYSRNREPDDEEGSSVKGGGTDSDGDDDDPGDWHTALEDHVVERAIDAVAPLLSADGAENVRRRYLLDKVSKSTRHMERLEEELLPFFDALLKGDTVSVNAALQLAERMEKLVQRLKEVSGV